MSAAAALGYGTPAMDERIEINRPDALRATSKAPTSSSTAAMLFLARPEALSTRPAPSTQFFQTHARGARGQKTRKKGSRAPPNAQRRQGQVAIRSSRQPRPSTVRDAAETQRQGECGPRSEQPSV